MDSVMSIQEIHERYFREIKTERLLLRRLTIDDAEDMYSYTSQAECFRFLRGKPHISVDEDREFLERAEESYQKHRDFIWGICKQDDHKLIGTCRIFDINVSDCRCEVSYLIHPGYQGQGIATEAVNALIHYAFRTLGFVRVQARCVVGNVGSEQVMIKCGMKQEGVLRKYAQFHGSFEDFKLYSILND